MSVSSATSARTSRRESLLYALHYTPFWIAAGLLLVALVVYLSLASGGPVVPVTFSDKIQHLLAYTVLALWFGGIFKRKALWLIVFALIGMGVILEFLQGMGVERTYDTMDMVMNGLGAVLGKKLCRFGLGGWCQTVERWVRGAGNTLG